MYDDDSSDGNGRTVAWKDIKTALVFFAVAAASVWGATSSSVTTKDPEAAKRPQLERTPIRLPTLHR